MSDKKTLKVTTPKQFDLLVELMEKHPHLARGFHTNLNKINIKDEWTQISHKLNNLGPPLRHADGWIKVWADFKFKLKKKLIHNKSECRATGGGPFKQFILSPTEEAASTLLQLETIINPRKTNFGAQPRRSSSRELEPPVADAHVDADEAEYENVEPPVTSRSVGSNKQNKKIIDKSVLLGEQLNVQKELYIEVKKSLKEIERYSRKTYKLKEEKLRLYKTELKKKDQHRKNLIQLRSDEIEIKKRKIELEELKSGFYN